MRLTLLNTISFIGVLIFNYLATALPVGGKTPGEVSDMFTTYFTPAGFTFSIWGIIYILLLTFIVFQWWETLTGKSQFSSKLGGWFAISCLANAGWLIAFHYVQIVWSMVIMLVLLFTLIKIFIILEKEHAVSWIFLPFRVYLAWICVATVANTSITFNYLGVPAMGEMSALATIPVILVVTGLASWMTLKKGDYAFSMVVIWALFGIFSKGLSTDAIAWTLKIGMGLLLLILVIRYFRLVKS
jgi:translocator protein